MQFNFGVGNLFAIPLGVTTPTPDRFGVVQDVSIDFSFSEKELYGQNQFPVAVARAKGKINGKAKFANIDATLYNDLFFGNTMATGIEAVAVDEAGTIPSPSGPYTVTVANSATFVADLGVVYTATGAKMTRVASVTVAGQYSVAAGVYTFYSADAGLGVKISYTYTSASTGNEIPITNNLMGQSPLFTAVLSESFQGKVINVHLNKCMSSKLSLPMKNEDYTIPEFDFFAMDDGTGNIGTISIK